MIKKKEILLISLIFIFIIALFVFFIKIMPSINNGKELTLEENYDEYLEEKNKEENSEKKDNEKPKEDTENIEVEKEDYIALSVKEEVVPLIATARWEEALEILNVYFEENYQEAESYYEDDPQLNKTVELLKNYQKDLSLLVQMAYVDQEQYRNIFTSFNAPETFLSAMIYYPFSVKISGFTDYESLVVTTETNNVAFYNIEKIENDEYLEEINSNNNSTFTSIYSQDFEVDGYDLTIEYIKTKDESWMVHKIISEDEDHYYMDVNMWRERLNIWWLNLGIS